MTVLIEDHGLPLISIGEPRRHRMTVEPRTEAPPLTAEEEARFRESLKAIDLMMPDDYSLQWSNYTCHRLLATLDRDRISARAAALREVAEKVRAMKPLDSGFNDHYYRGHEIARASVLAILTEATDTSATRAAGASE